jgi:hypothetical protein
MPCLFVVPNDLARSAGSPGYTATAEPMGEEGSPACPARAQLSRQCTERSRVYARDELRNLENYSRNLITAVSTSLSPGRPSCQAVALMLAVSRMVPKAVRTRKRIPDRSAVWMFPNVKR